MTTKPPDRDGTFVAPFHDHREELPVAPVSEQNAEVLEQLAPLYVEAYHDFKETFLAWLQRTGKNVFKGTGYAEGTVKQTHYKLDRAFRWKWSHTGDLSTEFTPEEADTFCTYLVQQTPTDDNGVRDHIKALKRYFKWRVEVEDDDIDWEYEHLDKLDSVDDSKSIHYFKQWELSALYDAAIDYGSFPSYRSKSITPEARDRLSAVLAQRFEKPKEEVGPDDWDRASSWKWPALIATSIDVAFRPIEVKRARTGWFNLRDDELVIPSGEASKSDEPWECVFSKRSVNALRRWFAEREALPKYEGTDAVWLTKYGNPYDTNSLNTMLPRLLERTEIEPNGRDLSWYAIRRGSATMWANNVGLEKAAAQLRHSKLETTQRYVKSETNQRRNAANELW